MIEIIKCHPEKHWPEIWGFMESVFVAGESYPIAMDVSEQSARNYWFSDDKTVFAASDENGIVRGTYYIRPNSDGLGAHICNCGYIVDPACRGRGIASQMCGHSQVYGGEAGYRGMQYNLVVGTNETAVRLWQKHGFEIIGTVPGAFARRGTDYVDAHIMFKSLV